MLVPLLGIGSLAVAPTPAFASTASPAAQAASTGPGLPNLGPTIAALDANVTALLNQAVTEVFVVICIPGEITTVLAGGHGGGC